LELNEVKRGEIAEKVMGSKGLEARKQRRDAKHLGKKIQAGASVAERKRNERKPCVGEEGNTYKKKTRNLNNIVSSKEKFGQGGG